LSSIPYFITPGTSAKKPTKITGLKRKLQKSQGLARIRILNELSGAVVEFEPATAKKYALAALKAAGNTEYPKENAAALFNIGKALFKLEQYDSAFSSFAKAIEVFETVECPPQAAQTRFYMGETRYYGGKYVEAIEHYTKALSFFESISDLNMIAQTDYRLGTAYGKINIYDQALSVLEKASEAFNVLGNMAGVGQIDGCIGLVFHAIGNYKKALKYHLRALRMSEEQNDPLQIAKNCVNTGNDYQCLGQADIALGYLNRALKIREKSGDIQGLISVHINIGTLCFGEKKYELGIVHNLKALELNKKRASIEVESFVLNNIGVAYTKLKQYKKAAQYLNKAYKIVRGANFPTNEELIMDSIAELAEAKGDYKTALKLHKRLKELQNKTFNEHVSQKIAELEARNEMKKREQEISHLKEKLGLQNRKLALLVGHSAEKRQLLESFQQELARIREKAAGGEEIIIDKKSLLKLLNTEKDMKKFRDAFEQVYPGYYNGLTALNKNLTKQEKNICLLIKIGLQSPMIANVLFISLRTVENHRLKIRQKIKLPNSQNLKTFLEAYSAE